MIPRNMAFLFGTLLIGCGEVPLDSKEPSGEVLTEDADGDGVSEEEGDCDDSNPNISPSATDLVGDEIDQNCDGVDGMDVDGDGYASEISGGDDCDDSDPEVYPADEDGDGSTLCDEVADCDDSNADINALDADGDGFSTCDETPDCNDNDADINPAAEEACDEIDNNCNGEIDEGAAASTWHLDSDGDGYGMAAGGIPGCSAPADGYVSNGDDCDDNDPLVFENCGSTTGADLDGDGQTAEADGGTDCDDNDATVYLGADELCDSIDNDCDGSVDEDAGSTWHLDNDGDGFGMAAGGIPGCEAPATGYVNNGDDCDDSVYDLTNSCSGPSTDADNDGYDSIADGGTDCDDNDATVNPGESETCDGVDNNCTGGIDEGLTTYPYYVDEDGDGYGDSQKIPVLTACYNASGYEGYSEYGNDCWDVATTHPSYEYAARTYPGAAYMDDGSLCMLDYDGDFYGDDSPSASNVTAGTDCDDSSNDVYPTAPEVCDTIDNDCDNLVDSNDSDVQGSDWYPDSDSDGKGDSTATPINGCQSNIAEGYVDNNNDCDDTDSTNACEDDFDLDGDNYSPNQGDCDDSNADINPDALENCDNSVDQNCDGNSTLGAADYVRDEDGDGLMQEGSGSCNGSQVGYVSISEVSSTEYDCFDQLAICDYTSSYDILTENLGFCPSESDAVVDSSCSSNSNGGSNSGTVECDDPSYDCTLTPDDADFDGACNYLQCTGGVCSNDASQDPSSSDCVPDCAALFGSCCQNDTDCSIGGTSGGSQDPTEVNCNDGVDDDGDGDTDCDDSDCSSDPGCNVGGGGTGGAVPDNAVICDGFDVCLSLQYGISGQSDCFDYVTEWENGTNTYGGWMNCILTEVNADCSPDNTGSCQCSQVLNCDSNNLSPSISAVEGGPGEPSDEPGECGPLAPDCCDPNNPGFTESGISEPGCNSNNNNPVDNPDGGDGGDSGGGNQTINCESYDQNGVSFSDGSSEPACDCSNPNTTRTDCSTDSGTPPEGEDMTCTASNGSTYTTSMTTFEEKCGSNGNDLTNAICTDCDPGGGEADGGADGGEEGDTGDVDETCEYNGTTYSFDDIISICDDYITNGNSSGMQQSDIDLCDYCNSLN